MLPWFFHHLRPILHDVTIQNLQDVCLKLIVATRARARELQVCLQVGRASKAIVANSVQPPACEKFLMNPQPVNDSCQWRGPCCLVRLHRQTRRALYITTWGEPVWLGLQGAPEQTIFFIFPNARKEKQQLEMETEKSCKFLEWRGNAFG